MFEIYVQCKLAAIMIALAVWAAAAIVWSITQALNAMRK